MENKNWYKTTIDISHALKPDWEYPDPKDLDVKLRYYFSYEIFNPLWLDFMESIELPIQGAMLFYRAANFNTPIAHIDVTKNDPSKSCGSALNWVIGGKNSKMHWYNIPNIMPTIQKNQLSTPYKSWLITTLTEIEQYTVTDQLTLVRVDIPHAVSMSDEPRWCFSVRLRDCDIISWDSTIGIMMAKNLLIDR